MLDGVERVYLFPFAYVVTESGAGFVEQAVKAGVRRFVVHSAAAAGFDPADDPGDRSLSPLRRHLAEERQAHRELESMVEAADAEWTHVRPGLLAANALGWAERIRAERVVREPYGTAGYPVVHEADIAEVAVAALLTDSHLGAAYTVTGPAKVSQAEQVKAIGVAVGEEIRFEELTPERGPRAVAPGRLPGGGRRLADRVARRLDRRARITPADRHLPAGHRTAAAALRAVGPRPCGRLPPARGFLTARAANSA